MDVKTFAAVRAYGKLPTPMAGDPVNEVIQQTASVSPEMSPDGLLRTPEAGNAEGAGDTRRDFTAVMREAARNAVAQMRRSEDVSMQALNGKADVQKLMQAMADAEMTVRTVTAVRDKVLEAYQEIVRMPM